MATVKDVARAFIEGRTAKCHNAWTDGTEYVLHRTTIARKLDADLIEFDWGGWWTPTTANHINTLLAAFGLPDRVSYAQARDRNESRFTVLTALH